MFEFIFLAIWGLYLLQNLIIFIGSHKKFLALPDAQLPTATIIMAARNEEDNILRCLRSLDLLIYPDDKLEIIIVNDHSTDKTGEIVEQFIQDKPRFKILVPELDEKLKGKTNALAKAIKIAKGDIILTTDADCEVSPLWAKSIASYYFNDEVGMVMGYTSQEAYGHFTGMQTLDFIYLLTLAAGFMNFGRPLSAIGNNMSYRKIAYEEVGGYENIPFSVTEDIKLLMTIKDLNKYKIIYPLDSNTLVVSEPCEDVKTLFRQKKRWAIGGLQDGNNIGYGVVATTHLTHVGILLTPILFSYLALSLTLGKLLIDLFVIYPVLKKFKLTKKIKYFLTFELYFIFYVFALPFMILFDREVIWKDRSFEN